MSKAQLCAGLRVQLERKRKHRGAAGQDREQAVSAAGRLQTAACCEDFLVWGTTGSLVEGSAQLGLGLGEERSLCTMPKTNVSDTSLLSEYCRVCCVYRTAETPVVNVIFSLNHRMVGTSATEELLDLQFI